MMKKMQLTILMERGNDGWIGGQLKEYPSVISQGKTIKELKENLKDALRLYLECQMDDLKLGKRSKDIKERTLIYNNEV